MLNDRQLLTKLKATKKQSDYEILYKRYLPMIDKYAYKVASSTRTTFGEVKEEFRQDAFISLTNAVEYTNLDKIENDEWKFQTIFYYFLKTLQLIFYKSAFNQSDSLDQYREKLENPKETCAISKSKLKTVENAMGVSGCHYEEFDECREQFMEQLTPRQQTILKNRQLGMTIDEIRQELKVSFGTVHRDIHYAKQLAEKIFIFE
jgi:RNA polymerase sigma factor (sigma-70 family)